MFAIKEKNMLKSSISIGNSGEYFVAGELERRGFTVAVPMSNTPAFDILVIRRDNNHQYALQVKTTSTRKLSWSLKDKNELINEQNVFYVFVHLNNLEQPDYYIVPSYIVAETITNDHKKWLETPGRKGQKHNDNKMRKFNLEVDNEYKDNWDLLK
jgi:hypothetical protein